MRNYLIKIAARAIKIDYNIISNLSNLTAVPDPLPKITSYVNLESIAY